MARTADQWANVLCRCGVRAVTAARWAPFFASAIGGAAFNLGDAELDDFLGQVLHESGKLERVEENLNYSADRLMVVFPTRFPTAGSAAPFARNPEALANKVYGGRLGNTAPGDGYRFRGRGLVQVTGRDNYRTVGRAMGLDLEASPELLSEPRYALEASIAWWEGRIPDSAIGDIVRVTKLVNGGTHGLDDRRQLTGKAREALG